MVCVRITATDMAHVLHKVTGLCYYLDNSNCYATIYLLGGGVLCLQVHLSSWASW
jgi:hypothetical protein